MDGPLMFRFVCPQRGILFKILMLEMLRGRMQRRRNVVAGRSPEQGEPVRKKRKAKKNKKEDCHQFATQEDQHSSQNVALFQVQEEPRMVDAMTTQKVGD